MRKLYVVETRLLLEFVYIIELKFMEIGETKHVIGWFSSKIRAEISNSLSETDNRAANASIGNMGAVKKGPAGEFIPEILSDGERPSETHFVNTHKFVCIIS